MIEVPFSEDVSKAGGESGAPALGENVTVAVDGENVTDRYVLDADGADDGQVVLTSATSVAPSASVAVEIDAVNDSADTETLRPGAVEATASDATVAAGGDGDAYATETVAFVTTEPDRAFEVRNDSGAVVLSDRTGNGSQVFAFDTRERNWTGAYAIDSLRDDGSVTATSTVTLDELELSVVAENRTVTTDEGIDARVSAADGGREVDVTLRDAGDEIVDRRDRTLDESGNATVGFDPETGNYTVEATDSATGTTTTSAQVRVVDADSQDGGGSGTEDDDTRDLELSVAVENRPVTTADGIEARVSATDGGHDVSVALRDAEGVVDRRDRTLDADGDATVAFDADLLAAAGPGNYTVNATESATGATAGSDRIRVVDADERTVGVRSDVVAEHVGDVAAFDVTLRYADTATVTVGGPDAEFEATATIVDRNGDGSVRLRFNTAAAADAVALSDDGGDVFGIAPSRGGASTPSDAVVATDVDADAAETTLARGEYRLTVRSGPSATAPASDAATLAVREPAPERLDTRVAPASVNLSTAADIATAAADGRLTNATEIAAGDTVVHRLVAPGIEGRFATAPGDDTEAFFSGGETEPGDVYRFEVTRRPAATADAYRFRPNGTTTRVVADPQNDTYFLIHPSDEVPAGPRNGTVETDPPTPDAPARDDPLSAAFVVDDRGPFADLDRANRTVEATHTVVAPRIDAAGPIGVTNATNRSLAGSTTLAPGTAFDVRLRPTNGSDARPPRTVRATVGTDGRWNVAVDFDDREIGDRVGLRSAVGIVPPANELDVVVEIRATPPTNASTTTRSAPAAGGGGGGGGGWIADDSAPGAEPSDPTSTTTPNQPTESPDSVVGSAQQFLGGVLGTTADTADVESLPDRLVGFDVAVPAVALVLVVVSVLRWL